MNPREEILPAVLSWNISGLLRRKDVSTNVQPDLSKDNGKPTKAAAAAAPVLIRRITIEEDARERMLKRQLPALVISGAIHVVFSLICVLVFSSTTIGEAKPKDDKLVEAKIEKEEEKMENFENPDVGFNADLEAATEADREEDQNVEAPVLESEPVGSSMEAPDVSQQVTAPPGFNNPTPDNAGVNNLSDLGSVRQGDGGAGGAMMSPGMRGRSGATKNKLLAAGGGNTESEAAVTRGLIWLAKQQNENDGSWVYDGTSSNDRIAATGMALLPFLAAGQTHRTGSYKKTVSKGLEYLKPRVKPGGGFTGASNMYSQAIGTIALNEAYGMTLDSSLKVLAQTMTNFIVNAQGSNGSWGYQPKSNGDTSIVGWQIQALKSAKLAGLTVPDKPMKSAAQFLEEVSTNSGASYGYSSKGASPALSAVGLLCRQYMGWGPKNPALADGVDRLWKIWKPNEARWDMYYYYYATQVVHFFGGPIWHKDWNPLMRDMLIRLQDKAEGKNKGSWKPDQGHIGSHCGRLGTTCLALLTLEVYYRHLPLYKREEKLDDLERGA